MSAPVSTPDYKSTIRLPQTDFPMKGDLPINEPKIIAKWESDRIYFRLLEKNKNKPGFTLPDGPPYANGSIHIGHALNKSLKDFIIKYKAMKGYYTPFVPGWDCHGLPIEHKVMKDLAAKKIVKTDQEILSLCREEALHWVNHQRQQFKRLGVMADWENPYLTMSKDYEAEEVREFARAFKRGVIYQGVKPVYWNWALKTALADAEVEYHDHKSPSIYVKFEVTDAVTLKKLGSPAEKTSFVIWTTTPWTLPANSGLCLHPEFDYALFSAEINGQKENLILAKALKEFFEKEIGLLLIEKKVFKGADLELAKARHPFIERDSIIVLGLHVTSDTGTGVVHTAPGHGADDFKIGQKYKLPVLNPVDDAGLYTDDFAEMKGINIFKANPLIVEKLKNSEHLLKFSEFVHSYPHCWRSKTPLIFRTTAQWFIGIDQETSPATSPETSPKILSIRQKTLKALEDIQFFPEWGRARFQAMIENRPDWCLSRQRIWGVPIPILICVATGEPLADYNVMMRAAEIVADGGIEAYYKADANAIAGSEWKKPDQIKDVTQTEFDANFGSMGFKIGRDILDVWFDSGVCHAAVHSAHAKLNTQFPYKNTQADIYLEGSDQHRGWFNTSMLSSMATTGKPPFKALITHGFVNDSQGRKMSKSLGNVIDPNEVSSKSGSEIIRLWAAYGDYGHDIGCGKEELTRVTETYRKIRNTLRFLLGATYDFNFSQEKVAVQNMTQIDQWMLHQLNQLIIDVTAAYDKYEFYKVYHLLNHFFTVSLSATYMDILKDRLYTWKQNDIPRKSAQTVLYYTTDSLTKMMAPILSFLAEETYSYFKGKTQDSVFLEDFPRATSEWQQPALHTQFEKVLAVRSDLQKKLEDLRAAKTIGSSLEAQAEITADGAVMEALKSTADLREILIVSKVEIKLGPYLVAATKAEGEKCVRCWIYSNQISKTEMTLGVCPKCVVALT